jgi:AhpD family alkylhydroperoxidase
MSQPRVAPGTLRETGVLPWAAAHIGGRASRTEPLHLFLTLGRHRKLLRAWLRFAGRLMPRGVLARRETELVILRVAHLRSCEYEQSHHLRLARRAGLDGADLDRVKDGPSADGWSPRERAILAAVDCMHESGDLDDGHWDGLRAHLDERECIELCMLAGHYEMLATTIAVLRIQPDQPSARSRSSARARSSG